MILLFCFLFYGECKIWRIDMIIRLSAEESSQCLIWSRPWPGLMRLCQEFPCPCWLSLGESCRSPCRWTGCCWPLCRALLLHFWTWSLFQRCSWSPLPAFGFRPPAPWPCPYRFGYCYSETALRLDRCAQRSYCHSTYTQAPPWANCWLLMPPGADYCFKLEWTVSVLQL